MNKVSKTKFKRTKARKVTAAKRTNRVILAAILLIFCSLGVVLISKSFAMASDYEVPGGFIWNQWSLNAASGYDSMEVTVKIEKLGANDSLTYVGVPFGFRGGGNGAYGGIQSHVSTLGGARGAIFTIWNVTGAQEMPGGKKTIDTKNCDGFAGAVCAQVALPYQWVVGKEYKWGYRNTGKRSGSLIEDTIEAYIVDVGTGLETKIGEIYIPSSYGKMYGLTTFLEVFPPAGTSGASANDCNKRVEVVLLAKNANANKGAVKSTKWYQQDSTKPPACQSMYGYEKLSNGYRLRHNSVELPPAPIPDPIPAPVVVPTPVPSVTPTPVPSVDPISPTIVLSTSYTTNTPTNKTDISATPIELKANEVNKTDSKTQITKNNENTAEPKTGLARVRPYLFISGSIAAFGSVMLGALVFFRPWNL